MAHRRSPTVIAEHTANRDERQAAKALVVDLNAFLDLWPTATQNQKIAQIKDLAQALKQTIKAAVL